MTVFVDDARNPLGRMVMSHMLATGEAELHAMANRIGVDRAHFQGDHYDVCQQMRAKAVELGAVEITQRDAVWVRRYWRAIRRGRPNAKALVAAREILRIDPNLSAPVRSAPVLTSLGDGIWRYR